MAGESQTTTDHNTIRQWAEERGGIPARVKGTQSSGPGAGLLRIHFPGYTDDSKLEQISWEEFFDTFEKKKLAFLYQDKAASGHTSRFFKFVSR